MPSLKKIGQKSWPLVYKSTAKIDISFSLYMTVYVCYGKSPKRGKTKQLPARGRCSYNNNIFCTLLFSLYKILQNYSIKPIKLTATVSRHVSTYTALRALTITYYYVYTVHILKRVLFTRVGVNFMAPGLDLTVLVIWLAFPMEIR